jgi:hypothetical protein
MMSCGDSPSLAAAVYESLRRAGLRPGARFSVPSGPSPRWQAGGRTAVGRDPGSFGQPMYSPPPHDPFAARTPADLKRVVDSYPLAWIVSAPTWNYAVVQFDDDVELRPDENHAALDRLVRRMTLRSVGVPTTSC